jgi:hypothetical protein
MRLRSPRWEQRTATALIRTLLAAARYVTNLSHSVSAQHLWRVLGLRTCWTVEANLSCSSGCAAGGPGLGDTYGRQHHSRQRGPADCLGESPAVAANPATLPRPADLAVAVRLGPRRAAQPERPYPAGLRR